MISTLSVDHRCLLIGDLGCQESGSSPRMGRSRHPFWGEELKGMDTQTEWRGATLIAAYYMEGACGGYWKTWRYSHGVIYIARNNKRQS